MYLGSSHSQLPHTAECTTITKYMNTFWQASEIKNVQEENSFGRTGKNVEI